MVARAVALFLLCLFWLFSFSFAQPNQRWGLDEGLYGVLALAVIVSAAFIALAYMLSQFLSVPALAAWVRIEVQELAISAIIVVFLVGMMATINVAVSFISGEEGYFGAAGDYLDSIAQSGQQLHYKLLRVGFLVNIAAGFSYSTSVAITPIPVGGNWGSAPMSGLGGLAGAVGNAVDSVGLTMLLLVSQKVFLVFFVAAAAVVMPLGVVLRTFPMSRRVGALLLAAGVSTAVVYPTALVVSGVVYNAYAPELSQKISNADKDVPNIGRPPASNVMCNPIVQLAISAFGLGDLFYKLLCWLFPPTAVLCEKGVTVWYSVVSSGVGFGMGMASNAYIGKVNAAEFVNPINENSLPAATEYVVIALVLSLLPIIATVIMVKNFASLFGGESQLYGLFRLVG